MWPLRDLKKDPEFCLAASHSDTGSTISDDSWHQVDVVAIDEKALKGKFPKVTNRVGKSPTQYANSDEDDGDEE